MYVILLYFDHQHVSVTYVAISRWFLWEQNAVMMKMSLSHSTVLKTI